MANETKKSIHHGRNIRRFRELMGYKQEALASALGDDWNQRKVSLLESKEVVEPELLDQVAKALKVPAEAIRNFDEEAAINNIACNFNDHASVNYKPVFNSMEKWLEALEEIKKLNAALIKEKDEKIALLERVLEEKK